MRSPIVKRSIEIGGKKTSVSVENAFWDEIEMVAAYEGVARSALIAKIDAGRRKRRETNLSSAIRQYVLAHYQERAARQRSAARGAAATTFHNGG